MGEICSQEATRAFQLGTSWQDESPFKEELELLRGSGDMRVDGTLIRQAIEAGTAGEWSELLQIDQPSAWRMKTRECYHEARQDDERTSIAQQVLRKSTDFLERIIVPVEGQGGVTLSYVCLHCHLYPTGTATASRRGKKQCN